MNSDEQNKCKGTSKYVLIREQIKTDLDPELQNEILRKASDAHDSHRIDVIARVKDPDGPVPQELQHTQKVGDVLTGTLKVNDIVVVREHHNILSLKGARPVHEALDHSVPEISATQQQLRAEFRGRDIDGSGVILGVIDHGCDFAHPNFQTDNGTRILCIWDQREKSERYPPPKNFEEGREFTSAHINEALQLPRPDCYQKLQYSVSGRSHGTRVLDIAAGSGTNFNPAGVAPGADIVFVDLANSSHPDESFGNSKHLIDALNYIFQKAAEFCDKEGRPRPVVVNVSLSSDSGPHDGSSLFERAMDNALKLPGRAVVIAAGNSAEHFEDNEGNRTLERHTSRLLQAPSPATLTWHIRDGDTTDNKIDLWYGGRHELNVSLITPSGELVGCFPMSTTTTICSDGQPTARIFHRRHDPNNQDNELLICFTPSMEPGDWTLKLTPLTTLPFMIHAWTENNGGKRSGFRNSVRDAAHTINSIACGYNSIAVGAYFSAAPETILPESSEGPTRDGRLKPELSAPGAHLPFIIDDPSSRLTGRGIRAAEAESDGSTRSSGGTSAAAPHAAGLIALLMQNAGGLLSITEIRDQLIGTTRRLNGGNCTWHPRFGYGRLDAKGAILSRTHRIFSTANESSPVSTD